MADNVLKIGAEFDVSQIVAGSEQAAVAMDNLGNAVARQAAIFQKQGLTTEETSQALQQLGYSAAEVAAALGVESAATENVTASTGSMVNAMGAARVEMGALSGSAGMMGFGLARVAAQSESLAPLLVAAFPAFAAFALVDILVTMSEKLYKAYENVVLLKDAIAALDKADMALAEHAAHLNETYEEGLARRLLAEGNFAAATAAFRKANEDKPLELPKIDDKMFKQFNAEFVAFLQTVHTTADIPSVITRINAEAESTSKQLEAAKKSLQDVNEISGEAMAYGGGGALMGNSSAQVDDLTKKLAFLKTMIGEVQSQSGIAGQALESSIKNVSDKEEQAAKKKAELASRDWEMMQAQQEEAVRGASEEMRRYDEVMRKQAEAIAKHEALLHEDAETEARINSELDAEDKKRSEEHQKLLRSDLETQQVMEARVEELETKRKEAYDKMIEHQMKAFAPINRAMDGMVNGILQGTLTVQQAFVRMGANIALTTIDALAKAALKWAEHEAAVTLMHAVGVQTRVAATATGEAETKAITGASTMAQVLQNAVKAGTAAAAAVAGIPVIGPILAIIAGDATFAAVMAMGALASAAGGAVIPADMPLNVHQGEMVLPERISTPLQNMMPAMQRFSMAMDGGHGAAPAMAGGGSSSMTNISVSAFDASSFRDFLHRNQRQFTAGVKGLIRNGVR